MIHMMSMILLRVCGDPSDDDDQHSRASTYMRNMPLLYVQTWCIAFEVPLIPFLHLSWFPILNGYKEG